MDWINMKKSIPSLKIPAGQYEIYVEPTNTIVKGYEKLGQYKLIVSSTRAVTTTLKTSKEMQVIKSKFAGATMIKQGFTCEYDEKGMWNLAKETYAELVKGAKAMKAKGIDCDKFAWAEGSNWGLAFCCPKNGELILGKTSWTKGEANTYQLTKV